MIDSTAHYRSNMIEQPSPTTLLGDCHTGSEPC